MYKNSRKAFTMMELIFVIVVIGILSAVAVPKFAATRDSAVQSKAASTLAAVRSSISTERQKRTLRGIFGNITSLHADGDANSMFTVFNDALPPNNGILPAQREVLEYPVTRGNGDGQWDVDGTGLIYTISFNRGASCSFTLANNRLTLSGSVVMTMARCQQIFDN